MSMSFHTKAKIPRSFFPAIGKTALLDGKPVKAVNYDGERDKEATSFILRDQNGFCMGLYFSSKNDVMPLDFFDFAVGNWGVLDGADQDGTWMRKAVLKAARKVKTLPAGPAHMPRKREAKSRGIHKAFEDLKDLRPPYNVDNVLYLPTSCLTCTVEEFRVALERHGMVVTQVEGRKAFRLQGPPDMVVDQNRYSSNYNDRYNWTDKDNPPLLLGEHRILPYSMEDPGWFYSLVFNRPVLPTDDLKRVRPQAWPLLESSGPADESPAVKRIRAEAAEKLRIANLDQENTRLRQEIDRLQGLLAAQV